METALPAVIIIGLLILASLIMSEQMLSSQDAVSASWREMQERAEERARTDLAPVGAETLSAGYVVSITLSNDGGTKLADFDQWDVILQYDDGSVRWYPFGQSSDEWQVAGIYLDASEVTAEAFEQDIFNPGEEMVIQVSLSLATRAPLGTHLATVATPNGITASTVFTR